MKKWVNGQIIEMTAEEIAAIKAAAEQIKTEQPSEPTTEERLAALESALLEMITGGESNG